MTTMSTFRLAGFAGLLVVAALVGGTIIGSVAASTAPLAATPDRAAAPAVDAKPPAGPNAEAAAKRCADFRKAFAANLGVDESALAPAAKKAAISTIEAAVTAGTITKEVGDKLKARVEAADADACALLAGRIGVRAGAGGGVGGRVGPALGVVKDGLAAAATALGMTPDELGARLRGGDSLKDVAVAKGVPYATVSAAVVASVKKDLDAAVAAGKIPQARADRILERLEKNLADGRLRGHRPGGQGAPDGPNPPTSGG
jgi:ribosomal protein S20